MSATRKAKRRKPINKWRQKKMKRRIVIPETITVVEQTVNGEVKEDVPFKDLVIKTLLQDRRLSASRDAMRQADDIEDLFRDVKPGDIVDMPESLWKPLSQAAEKPQFGGQGNIGFLPIIRQMIIYLDVICDAKEPPKEEA